MTRSLYEYTLSSERSVEELKVSLSNSYERLDTIKFEELDPKYKDWPGRMRLELRSNHLNNPNIHYLGRYYQGNFELNSPRLFYWRNVLLYVRHAGNGAKVHLTLEYFWLTSLPILLLSLISLLSIESHQGYAWWLLLLSIGLLIWQYVRVSNTITYFKKYVV